MEFNINSIKQSIGESRTKESALKCIKILMETCSDTEVEINKEYYVSEWSWEPICDGNFPCVQTIRFRKSVNGIDAYATGTSHRTYFAWDLFEEENECKEMCEFKNSFGYNWERAISNFREQKGIPWDFERCFEIAP